ncbi:uncharacterized protein LY89DRAFT_724443 [Mollisia scopiformis]|uniref:Uncharacterized protein n=1 Tax=Mollisia scopiformis TaxID=149040 RepID=A0A132BCS2_MOLSC|nr:uncharacterized protein LY89DRAFT_724443 [Mollisia scopiformis]KUJ09457.1 hypothetical protein LY89DRAFT_724443 [Mollisia scopiformis]
MQANVDFQPPPSSSPQFLIFHERMALQLRTAEEAQCCRRNVSAPDPDHTSRLHISLSSLPSPDTPITIPSFPIEIRSETSVFRPRNIANLWTQLLSIHIQNGNFWKLEDAVRYHKETTPPPALSREEVKKAEITRLEKGVLYIRHKVQKGLLTKDQQPIEAELPEISRLISKLESFGDIDVSIILSTKIHKVCKAILKLEWINGDEMYQFKSRSAVLLDRYLKILDQAPQQPSAAVSTTHQTDTEARSQSAEEDLKETPAICLTQLTPEQCSRIEEAAKNCNPPLDRGVVELMCMLPHFISRNGNYDLQVVPMGRLEQPLDDFPKIDRGVYCGGPTIPPNMLKLTYKVSPTYGISLFVDTKTGEGLQLDRWGPAEQGVMCTEFEGLRRPIEGLLQEWIDLFLKMKLVPTGGEGIMSDQFRSMDYLKLKFLMQEYDWPSSFPLSQSDYVSLIKRQADIDKKTFARYERNNSLEQIWAQLTQKWHNKNMTDWRDDTKIQELETFKILDRLVERALKYHIRKIEDRQYALAADEPLDKNYTNPLVLSRSGHGGSDGSWRVDATPDMIIERFNEVAGQSPWEVPEVKDIKKVLDDAYERWKLSEKGIHPRDDVDEEDDDETSDYVPSEEECSEEEEFESDEEDLDFDVVMLEEDITTDIEDLRKRMEGYHIGGS